MLSHLRRSTSDPESVSMDSPFRGLGARYTSSCLAASPSPRSKRFAATSGDDLDSLISASPSTAQRRRSRPLPPKFRPQMPTSARKAPSESQGPLPSERLGTIEKKSFYGGDGPKSKICAKLLLGGKRDEEVAPVPPIVSSKKKKTSSPRGVKRRRSSSTAAVSKRTKKKGRDSYEINKAVSHSIKPPKLAKTEAAVIVKTESATPPHKAVTTPKSKSLFKMTPGRVGTLTSSVNYVLKNGQYQFIRRRSPRKANLYSTPSPTKSPMVRKTPKLFTPSKNFLQLSPHSSPSGNSSRRSLADRFIPSPVKFHKVGGGVDCEEEEDAAAADMSNDVSGLIDTLNGEKEEVAKEDDYAVYVTDDELSKVAEVAWSAVQEISDLNDDGSHFVINSELVGEELQSLRYEGDSSSDGGLEDEVGKENRLSTPRRTSPRKSISTNVTPMKVVSGNQEKVATTPDGVSPARLYSIFGKDANTGFNGDPATSTPTTSGRKRKFVGGSSTAKNDDGLNQMIIDAGQKKIGSHPCETCKFFYDSSDAKEVKLHDVQHKKYLGLLAFPGWKNERLVQEDPVMGLKIVRVKPGDPRRHWDKVHAVLEIVDAFLGTSQGIRQPARAEVYLASIDKTVAGCLVAEPILESDCLSKSYPKDDGVRVLSEDLQISGRSSLCGVSRIWVHEDYQRKGVASRLMEALRCQYRLPQVVQKKELAFSHTSEMGAAFASKYFGRPDFLVYRPA